MPLSVCVLASGSSGNATLIWNENTALLIDCGRSRKYIEETMHSIGVCPSRVAGLLLTHGHSDHIGTGTFIFSRTRSIPLFLHEETYELTRHHHDFARIAFPGSGLLNHHAERPFKVGDFDLHPISTFHQGGWAGKTFGFSISCKDGRATRKIGFVTDTGKTDPAMIEALAGADVLVLEANHDPELVARSSRHYLNKKWILSDHGHLSNGDCARAIAEIRHYPGKFPPLKHVFLAHISEQHNTPAHALAQVKNALLERGVPDVELHPTYHRRKSAVITV